MNFARSLVGVTLNQEGEWQIWGLVHSGTVAATLSWRPQSPTRLSQCAVIWIRGPGRLTVLRGTESLATLTEGRIITPAINVFESVCSGSILAWLNRSGLKCTLLCGSNKIGIPLLIPNLPAIIVRQAIMRIISTMREAHKGGTIIILPHERRNEFTSRNPLLNIKYQFQEDEARYRSLRLMLETLQTLAEEKGDKIDPGKELSWQEYIDSDSQKLSCLEEAWVELSHQAAILRWLTARWC